MDNFLKKKLCFNKIACFKSGTSINKLEQHCQVESLHETFVKN